MKTGVEAYEEVRKLAKVDVIEIMGSDAYEANYERTRVSGRKRASEYLEESSRAQSIVADLIACARSIASHGQLSVSSHEKLNSILERIA